MGTPSWPETVGEAQEVDLVYGIEDFHDRPLKDFILQGSNAQGALPAVRFGDVYPPRGFGPVGSPVHPRQKILKISLQAFGVGFPVNPIHPSGRLPFQPVES